MIAITNEDETQDTGPLSVGDRINQFEVRSVLGEGGTAVVYEAVHTRLNSTVALKVVNMRSPCGPSAAARLQREAELCAAVEDPHVPKVFDIGSLADGTPYLVMERVVGPTLESLLERERLPLELGTAVLRDLLCAVEAVQRAGVVHRDIKPSNVIVQFAPDGSPSVRLMDFGVSRSLWLRQGGRATAVTSRGTIVGTPEYMAPEQINDRAIDARTDVYALGVVAYELFAGRTPFTGDCPAEIVAAVLRREYAPLTTLRRDIPARLAKLIERAMAAAPEDRYPSAFAMRAALDACSAFPVTEEGLPTAESRGSSVPGAARAWRSSSKLPRVALGLSSLGCLVLGVWFAWLVYQPWNGAEPGQRGATVLGVPAAGSPPEPNQRPASATPPSQARPEPASDDGAHHEQRSRSHGHSRPPRARASKVAALEQVSEPLPALPEVLSDNSPLPPNPYD